MNDLAQIYKKFSQVVICTYYQLPHDNVNNVVERHNPPVQKPST